MWHALFRTCTFSFHIFVNSVNRHINLSRLPIRGQSFKSVCATTKLTATTQIIDNLWVTLGGFIVFWVFIAAYIKQLICPQPCYHSICRGTKWRQCSVELLNWPSQSMACWNDRPACWACAPNEKPMSGGDFQSAQCIWAFKWYSWLVSVLRWLAEFSCDVMTIFVALVSL